MSDESAIGKKNPWFRFFPSDWRGDGALRSCSPGARALWLEMLCIMYEAEAPGHLLLNGKDVTTDKLARSSGFSVPETKEWLEELEEAGVFSRSPGGTIFSRKMVRDAQKSDEQRKRVEARWEKERNAKANTDRNTIGITEPDTETIPQKPEATSTPDRSEANASSCVQSGTIANDDFPPDGFVVWYGGFPNKVGRADAERKFNHVRKARQATFAELIAGRDRYIRTKPPDRPWCNPATWLHQQRWADAPANVTALRPGNSNGSNPPKPTSEERLRPAYDGSEVAAGDWWQRRGGAGDP